MTKPGNYGRKEKILLITRYFPPLDSTATSRMYSWAKYLARAGFKVSILTTSKKGQVVKPYLVDTSSFNVYEVDYFDPITFAGLDKKDTLKKLADAPDRATVKKWFLSKLSRIYRERMNERIPGRTDPWIIPAIRELKRQKQSGQSHDLIISSYGPPSAHIVGFFAKKIFHARWIADYRDLWLENHIYVGMRPFTWLEGWIEKRLIARSTATITVSKYLRSVLQNKFPHVPANVIENGFDPDDIDNAQSNYFSEDKTRFRLVYTGSIYRGKRDPSPLFRAIRELIDSSKLDPSSLEVHFWGSMQGDIQELIQKYQLSAVATYNGPVPKEEALDIQKSADALLFLEWSDSEDKDILTAKIFEYLATDNPILAVGITADSAVGRLIETSGSGTACGNNVEAIKEFILKMLNNSLVLQKDRELINHFSRKAEVGRLIRCLRGEVVHGIDF